MKQLSFTKSRVVFLAGILIIFDGMFYLFKDIDKLVALLLIIFGLIMVLGAMMYVLFKNMKQMKRTAVTDATVATPRSMVVTGIIETLAYMFFI